MRVAQLTQRAMTMAEGWEGEGGGGERICWWGMMSVVGQKLLTTFSTSYYDSERSSCSATVRQYNACTAL